MITSTIISVTYGKSISGIDDEYVIIAEKSVEGLIKAAIPGEFWIEYLPFLKHIPKWVPGIRWKKFVEHYLPYIINMRDKPYHEVKAAVVSTFQVQVRYSHVALMYTE